MNASRTCRSRARCHLKPTFTYKSSRKEGCLHSYGDDAAGDEFDHQHQVCERNRQGEKSGPTAGVIAQPTTDRSIKRNEMSKPTAGRKRDREELLRACLLAGTLWQEAKTAKERERTKKRPSRTEELVGATEKPDRREEKTAQCRARRGTRIPRRSSVMTTWGSTRSSITA